MESFFSRYRNALVLITLLLAQVIGLAVQVRRPGQAPGDKGGVLLIRAWVVGIVSPPERLLHATGLGIRGVWANYLDLIHVRQENRNLQEQLDQLRLEEASLAEDARQGERLQALLGFREKYIYKTVAAQVIGTAGTDQSHVLLIDKGSSAGIAPDMPVITPDGIVGKTRDVFDHTSQVLEISDATSGAGVVLEQTRIQGVLRGNTWGQPEIVNVSPDERIKAGEPVVTSGGDSIYPRGLAVGTVDRVVPEPDGTLVNVLVKPAANLSKLEEVLIIISAGSQLPAAMQQDLSDAQQRAADILAERLPSRADPNAPPTGGTGQNGPGQNGAGPNGAGPAAENPNAPPPLPPKPPPPIHPDHYSSSEVPQASDLVPGQRITSPEVEPENAAPAANPSGSKAAGAGASKSTGGTAGKIQGGSASKSEGSAAEKGKTGAGEAQKKEGSPKPTGTSATPGSAARPAPQGAAGQPGAGQAGPGQAGAGQGRAAQARPAPSTPPQTTPPQASPPQATPPQGRD